MRRHSGRHRGPGYEVGPGRLQTILPASLGLRRSDCRRRYRTRRALHDADFGHETIASRRYSLDVLFAALFFSERLAQHRQVMGQIPFLNDGIGPNRVEELLLAYQVSMVLHEHTESVKD